MLRQEFKEEQDVDLTPASYQLLKSALLANYITPFINEISDLINREFIIRIAVENLTRHSREIAAHEKFPTLNTMPSRDIEFKGISAKANEIFIKITDIFCYKESQINIFPRNNCAQIETCIRELFLEELDPVKALSKTNFQEVSTQPVSNIILNLPLPLATIVHSYLDYETCQQLSHLSRATALFNKSLINKPENILYMMGDEICISKSRGWGEGSLDISCLLLKDIPDKVIMKSLPAKSHNFTRVYSSLFHALEFAHYVQRGGDPMDGDVCHYRPVWAVRYQGNINELKLIAQQVVINEGTSASNYESTERQLAVIYANAKKDSVVPLRGAVAYSCGFFAEYKVYKPVDYRKDAVYESSTQSCTIS